LINEVEKYQAEKEHKDQVIEKLENQIFEKEEKIAELEDIHNHKFGGYLDITKDAKRLDRTIRALEKRVKKTKSDDLLIKLANSITYCTEKKIGICDKIIHLDEILARNDKLQPRERKQYL